MTKLGLVVVGGPAAASKDRTVPEHALRPVQALVGETFTPLSGFSLPAGSGMSNMASVQGQLIWSSGNDLVVGSRLQHRPLPVSDLADVHEITVDESHILVANTRADEVIVFDRFTFSVVERLNVDSGGTHHLNQAFIGPGGSRFALVHHLGGRELRKRLAGRVLKVQGDGGVINLDTGKRHELRLTAPHSVRLVDNQIWILDSGRARVLRYDTTWSLLGVISVAGWGRGAALSPDGKTLWVGLSPLRPRYQGFVEGPAVATPAVIAIDVDTKTVTRTIPVEGMDQISGVHLLNTTALDWCEPSSP